MPTVNYNKDKGLFQNNGNGVKGLLRRQVITLEDQGAATAIRSAITEDESGALFLVPTLTTGIQTIALPAPTASLVGCYYDFMLLGDISTHVFNVETDASATKIIAVALPDGDGTHTVSATSDKVGFAANGDQGAAFRLTCISSTAATCWAFQILQHGLAAGTGEFARA